MTYEAIKTEFLDCIDKGIITITRYPNGDTDYNCTHSCRTSSNRPNCPIGHHNDRWCKHDGQYSDKLLYLCRTKYPELFI